VHDVEAEIAAVEQTERTAASRANHANHVTISHPPEHQAAGMENRRPKNRPSEC
jgi:hypothetical protein